MTVDNQAFVDLIKLLEEESQIYTEMRDLLDREREALLHLKATELGEIVSRKETLGLRIKALDESRKVLSERLGRRLGIAPEELTVTALCRYAPRELAERLDSVRTELRSCATECKAVNDYNAQAAHRGLDLITGAVQFLLDEADPAGKVYQKKAKYGSSYVRSQGPAMISQEV